jgi:hypothetical protein
MTRFTLASVATLLAGAAAAGAQEKVVAVTPNTADRRVDVAVDAQPFTSYVWPARLAKPVLYPIRTARGSFVTRGFPLDPRPGERVDHPHQVGLWFNHGDVNGVDFWNNSEVRSAEERAKMGTVRHEKVVAAASGSPGRLVTEASWVMPDGGTALSEHTRWTFRAGADWRSIERRTVLTAGDRKVTFTDNKEGMLGLRVARALEEPSDKPEVFTDASGRPTTVAALDNTGVNGVYTSSEGLTGAKVWGTRARWVALSGKLGDEDVVLLLFDHPKNPGHPTYWHARGYGLFAANPFGAKVFSDGKEELHFSIEKGGTAALRHLLLILPGPFSKEKAEHAYAQFAAAR